MEQEASQEFDSRERHRPPDVAVCPVPVRERDAIGAGRDDATVADVHAFSATELSENNPMLHQPDTGNESTERRNEVGASGLEGQRLSSELISLACDLGDYEHARFVGGGK